MIDLMISPRHKPHLEMLIGARITEREWRKLLVKATRKVNDDAYWVPREDQFNFDTAMRHYMAYLYFEKDEFLRRSYRESYAHHIRNQIHKYEREYETEEDEPKHAWWEEPVRFSIITAIFTSGAYLVSLI